MDWRTTYRDLCKEIEILETRDWQLEREFIQIRRQMMRGPSGERVASYDSIGHVSHAHVPINIQFERLQEIERQRTDLDELLTTKKVAKATMEQKMNEFEGLEYRVAYLRDIEGKHLDEIAEELGFSYNWISKISSKIKRIRPSA